MNTFLKSLIDDLVAKSSSTLVTTWTVAFHTPLSMGFPKQEHQTGYPAIPFSRDLPDPGIEPGSPALHADPLPSEPPMYTYLKTEKKKMSKEINCNIIPK